VGRAIDVLEALAAGDGKGMSVGDVAEAIHVSRSTAFTLLQALVGRNLVADVRVGGARLYRLGLALVHLGERAVAEIGITQIATPILQELADAAQMTSRLAVLDDGYAVAVGRADSQGPFRIASSLGRRELPHCSAVGKALLSRLSATEALAILARVGMPKRTEHTITSADALMADLRDVARRGYAFDNEEDNNGVVCVGSAIYDRSGAAVAAVSVTTMKLDRSEDDLHRLGVLVRSFADRISHQLGGPSHSALAAPK
jgi:IclR family acetate operon transcriptional repressor